MPFQYHIREMTAETTVAVFVEGFVRVEKFLPFCRQCDSYNTRWTCPPFDFDPMTVWRSYTGLRLYARVLQADVPEQPLEGALNALKQEKQLYRTQLQQWERATPDSQMLLARMPGVREGAGPSVQKAGAAALFHRSPGRRCGGLLAALFPQAHALGTGRQGPGLFRAGGRAAAEVIPA